MIGSLNSESISTDTDLHIYYVHIHSDNKKGACTLVLLHVFVNKSITVILSYAYHFFLSEQICMEMLNMS